MCENVEEITLNELKITISEFMANKKTELREINKLSSIIRSKLEFMHHNNLERTNAKLVQRVSELHKTYDDCHHHIRELVHENLILFEVVEKFGYAQDVLIRVENREEKLEFSKFKCDNASTSESKSVFKEKGETTEFLGDFRRGFLY